MKLGLLWDVGLCGALYLGVKYTPTTKLKQKIIARWVETVKELPTYQLISRSSLSDDRKFALTLECSLLSIVKDEVLLFADRVGNHIDNRMPNPSKIEADKIIEGFRETLFQRACAGKALFNFQEWDTADKQVELAWTFRALRVFYQEKDVTICLQLLRKQINQQMALAQLFEEAPIAQA